MNKYLSVVLLISLAFIGCKSIQKNGIAVKNYDSYNDDRSVNALIEIPAGTLEKWEYNKSTRKIELELVNNKPRIINYLGYPANYGMIPKTLLPKNNGGDGDPLDVIVIGPSETKGNIVKCKIIGVLQLIDNSEQDDKLIAISYKSTLDNVNDISELDASYNGILEILEIWFTNYKEDGQIKSMGYDNRSRALKILEESRVHFINNQ